MSETFQPSELLKQAADLFEQRGQVYGENYKSFGPVMAALFPSGLPLHGPEDFNRLGVFVQIVAKISRYAHNFEGGGHDDSLADLSVYAAMLRSLDTEALLEAREKGYG